MHVPVLLPKIFDFPLTYKSKLNEHLDYGDLVEVPFGNQTEIGVVWKNVQKTKKKFLVKNILRKINNTSLNKKLLDFIEWFSMYNLIPLGQALKLILVNKYLIQQPKEMKKFKNDIIKKKIKLNDDQKKAVKLLNYDYNNFRVDVLKGVTGSGKTLVYFKKIKEVIDKNGQALIMLPEIFLTTQFEKRFTNFFGFSPSLWHSKISKKNKNLIWNDIHKGKIKIIIGARSSLFLPFKNLKLIVVDEEHDQSYKQEDVSIYNARDMAITRASFEKIPIILVTSIPSLETYKNIVEKKYKKVELKSRYNNYPLPKIKIIELDYKKKFNYISDKIIKITKNFLDKNQQILFFVNRRGYAPVLICKNCGYKCSCPNCSIYQTYHKLSDKLICHYCNKRSEPRHKCKRKGFCEFKLYGPGVEKVYEEIKKIFPKKNILIFSSDYLSSKKKTIQSIKDIEKNKIDIIIGTQMISKGFNFPKLNCIVVVDADFSGKGYDLRSTEKNLQLYHQLSGRAGRHNDNSQVVFQIFNGENKFLDNYLNIKVDDFLEKELILRKENSLPPFKRLIALIVSGKKMNDVNEASQILKNKLVDLKKTTILGPVEAPIQKIKKYFRSRILLKFDGQHLAQKELKNVLNKLKISSKIKLTVDVDPLNFS